MCTIWLLSSYQVISQKPPEQLIESIVTGALSYSDHVFHFPSDIIWQNIVTMFSIPNLILFDKISTENGKVSPWQPRDRHCRHRRNLCQCVQRTRIGYTECTRFDQMPWKMERWKKEWKWTMMEWEWESAVKTWRWEIPVHLLALLVGQDGHLENKFKYCQCFLRGRFEASLFEDRP